MKFFVASAGMLGHFLWYCSYSCFDSRSDSSAVPQTLSIPIINSYYQIKNKNQRKCPNIPALATNDFIRIISRIAAKVIVNISMTTAVTKKGRNCDNRSWNWDEQKKAETEMSRKR